MEVYGICDMARLMFSGCVNADVVRQENPKLLSEHGAYEARIWEIYAVK